MLTITTCSDGYMSSLKPNVGSYRGVRYCSYTLIIGFPETTGILCSKHNVVLPWSSPVWSFYAMTVVQTWNQEKKYQYFLTIPIKVEWTKKNILNR